MRMSPGIVIQNDFYFLFLAIFVGGCAIRLLETNKSGSYTETSVVKNWVSRVKSAFNRRGGAMMGQIKELFSEGMGFSLSEERSSLAHEVNRELKLLTSQRSAATRWLAQVRHTI